MLTVHREEPTKVLSLTDGKNKLKERFKDKFDFDKLFTVLEDDPWYAVDCDVFSEMRLEVCQKVCEESGLPPILATRISQLLGVSFASDLKGLQSQSVPDSAFLEGPASYPVRTFVDKRGFPPPKFDDKKVASTISHVSAILAHRPMSDRKFACVCVPSEPTSEHGSEH